MNTYIVRRRFRYGDKTYFEGDTWQPLGNKWDKLIVQNRLVALKDAPAEQVTVEATDDAIEPVQQRARSRGANAPSA